MNILFLSRDYPPNIIGGVGIYIDEISRLLVKMGHKAYVITSAENDNAPLEYINAGVRIFRVKSRRFCALDSLRHNLGGFLERIEYSLAVSRKIKEVIKRYQIDVIETSEARAEGFWYYLFRKQLPLIIKLHTPETLAFRLDHTPETLDYRLIKLLEEFWIGKACRIAGISKEVVSLTEQHFSIKLNNTPLLPNPIDIEVFRPLHGEPSENGNMDILYVGRLEFRKGVHTLIRAMQYVQEHLPAARLTLIGADCGMKGYLLKKISQLKYQENIILIDYLPRSSLISYYQNSAVCVVPSIWENYPYVCLEAMSCGRPVIASSIGGLKDMIIDRKNGILVRPGSSKELGEAIVALLKDKHLMGILGINARRSIEERCDPEKIAGRVLKLYQDILSETKCITRL